MLQTKQTHTGGSHINSFFDNWTRQNCAHGFGMCVCAFIKQQPDIPLITQQENGEHVSEKKDDGMSPKVLAQETKSFLENKQLKTEEVQLSTQFNFMFKQ